MRILYDLLLISFDTLLLTFLITLLISQNHLDATLELLRFITVLERRFDRSIQRLYLPFTHLVKTAYMSIGLGLFNLIPISPLDGSKVLFAFLPDRAYLTLMRYEKYGMLVLFVLVWLGVGDNILSEGIYRVYELLVNWIVY